MDFASFSRFSADTEKLMVGYFQDLYKAFKKNFFFFFYWIKMSETLREGEKGVFAGVK